MRSTTFRLCFGLALLFAACGDSSSTGNADMATPDLMPPPRPPLGQPITVPDNTWTWVDFPESSCDDGSPTGIGISLGSKDDLLIFMNGGGACWDYQTCFVLNTATHGPFGKAQFDALAATLGKTPGTVFDRNAAGNPFAGYTMVFVPYCTGDLHAGHNLAMYQGGGSTHPYHHWGRANLEAYIPRIAGTLPDVKKLVVSGSSAGGYGAALNYELFRRYWPTSEGYLLDDSGPLLEGQDIPTFLVNAMYTEWKIGDWANALCADCMNDVSEIHGVWAKLFPRDRMALLSSLQDQTIRGYLLKSPQDFQDSLLRMAHDVLDTLPQWHYFFVDGQTHTMLGQPTDFSSQGVDLDTWLTTMVTDDGSWKSLTPQ